LATELPITSLLYILTFGYITAFVILGAAKWKRLRTNPTQKKVNGNWVDKTDEEIARVIDENAKYETASFTIAGFALASVIFVFATTTPPQNDTPYPANIQDLTIFLSIGMILEILSGLLYRILIMRIFIYLGYVTQYAGLLALLCGFFAFFRDNLAYSQYITVVFTVGICVYTILASSYVILYMRSLAEYE
jgi:hypothetical protein